MEFRGARRTRIEVGQSETTFSFVAAGAGVAVVDPISVHNNPDARISVSQFEPPVEFDVWLILPKAARPFNLIDKFVDYIVRELNTFAEHLAHTKSKPPKARLAPAAGPR